MTPGLGSPADALIPKLIKKIGPAGQVLVRQGICWYTQPREMRTGQVSAGLLVGPPNLTCHQFLLVNLRLGPPNLMRSQFLLVTLL